VRAPLERFSVRITEFQFDMLSMALHRLAADAELLRDLSRPVLGSNLVRSFSFPFVKRWLLP
jgi:hypothetical protein